MACLHCHVHKSCLPDLHQICSVTTVFWTGSRRDVSELCNHQERSSLPTDFTGLYLQCQLGSLFGFECYDWLWLVTTMNELRTSSCCAVEVESFARKAPITETNLDRLERRIQSRAQGKAWESRSESRKVEKSFDKSASYTFTKVFKDIQRQLAQTVDGASTVSKAISGISRLGKLGSSGKVMPTCKARKGDVSDVNQSEFWLFHVVQLFPTVRNLGIFQCLSTNKDLMFRNIFVNINYWNWSNLYRLSCFFFWIFVSLCPNCYGLVWFIEDPSRGSTLAWVKGARVPRQKRKSNTICQETT